MPAGLKAVSGRKDPIDIGVLEHQRSVQSREHVGGADLLHARALLGCRQHGCLLVRNGDVPTATGIDEGLHDDWEIYPSSPQGDVCGIESGGTKSRVLEPGGEGVRHGIPEQREDPGAGGDHPAARSEGGGRRQLRAAGRGVAPLRDSPPPPARRDHALLAANRGSARRRGAYGPLSSHRASRHARPVLRSW